MNKVADDVIAMRPLSLDHYDTVFTLWKECEGIGLSQADSRESIQGYLERNPNMSFVATSGDAVVGAVLCGHDGRRGYIHHLAVHPNYRRRALGRRLVQHSLAGLARDGIQKCHLFIMNHNQAGIAFWKSVGWTPRNDISVISKNIEPERPTRTCC